MVIIDGSDITISWDSYKKWGYDEHDNYNVMIKTRSGSFKKIDCDNTEKRLINQFNKSGLCKLKAASLMSEPFMLYYGDIVTAQVKAFSSSVLSGNTIESTVGISSEPLHPFISGQLEFGYHDYGYYPFHEEAAYPSEQQLMDFDVTANSNIT